MFDEKLIEINLLKPDVSILLDVIQVDYMITKNETDVQVAALDLLLNSGKDLNIQFESQEDMLRCFNIIKKLKGDKIQLNDDNAPNGAYVFNEVERQGLGEMIETYQP
ncbi:MAG: hypothetical protein ACFFG0_04075 [Candidatus Thorarchaeota archaeon]